MSSGQVGTAVGLAIGIFGGIGTFFGGKWADKLAKRDLRWHMWLPAIAFLVAVPVSATVFLVDKLYLSLSFYCAAALLTNIYTGPTFGSNQTLAPLAMRAAASALLLFIINIIGLVFGPTVLGAFSDFLQADWNMNDGDSLRYALLACSLIYLVSAINYYNAARHIGEDMATAASS